MNAISRRSLLARGGLLLAAGTVAADTPVHGLAAKPQARSGNFKQIDVAMEQAVRDGTFGKANTVTGATMRADTVFWLLSMTKAFTATACMQLVEQGRIDPEDDAEKYLPELANPMVLEGFDGGGGQPRLRPAKRAIKVRHLLTHTFGYTYSIWSDALIRYEQVTGIPDIATSQNGAFLAPLEFDPGDRWQYGISMDWVGKLVEAVSDQSPEVYFRENIFAPLDMTDSGFLIGSKQKARVATFHNRNADGGLTPAPFEMPQRPEFFMGGGGAFSTPRNYMAFLRMLLNGGTHRRARVLKPETVAAMMRNQIGDLDVHAMTTAQPGYSRSFDQFPGEPHKWGYSFDINTLPGSNGRSAGSISWAGLLNCYFWLDPVRKVTGAIVTQVLPFYDEKVVKLCGTFECGLYDGLA